jgi:hypothetical protein
MPKGIPIGSLGTDWQVPLKPSNPDIEELGIFVFKLT